MLSYKCANYAGENTIKISYLITITCVNSQLVFSLSDMTAVNTARHGKMR